MPQTKSAKKRMKLDRRRGEHNKRKRSRIRSAMKNVREAEDPEVAQERLSEAFTLLDRAATNRLMHPNKVNRLKSQLSRHVNDLKS